MLFTKEHYDLMAQFEKEFKYLRLDKEEKSWWASGNIYQDGYVNALFNAFRLGYAFGKFTQNKES